MIISDLPLPGLKLIELEKRSDERGFFARSYCADEFAAAGLPSTFVQQNISFSRERGTLRGIHFQVAPFGEAKLARCTRGAIWDLAIDLREESPSFGKWHGVELTADNRLAVLVPAGFGHAFLTLSDDSEAMYISTLAYRAAAERVVRWDDPMFAIQWPIAPRHLSDKDRHHPDFARQGAAR